MSVIAFEVPEVEEDERVPVSQGWRETRLRGDFAELLAEPRCPFCHAPLRIRMTRRGPDYHCGCDE